MNHYQQNLKDHNIKQSMSRKGNCYGNTVMENFFGILKSECFYTQRFKSVEELEDELHKDIDYYNHNHKRIKHKRIKLKLILWGHFNRQISELLSILYVCALINILNLSISLGMHFRRISIASKAQSF